MPNRRRVPRSGLLPHYLLANFQGLVPDEKWPSFKHILEILWGYEGLSYPAVLKALRIARMEFFNQQLHVARLDGSSACALDWLTNTESTARDLHDQMHRLWNKGPRAGARSANLRAALRAGGLTPDDLRELTQSIADACEKISQAAKRLRRPRSRPAQPWKQRARSDLRSAGVPQKYINDLLQGIVPSQPPAS